MMMPGGPTVYLVDDDESLLRGISRLLTAAGYAVAEFTSATAFLAQHEPQNRGCVIADLRMPGVSGLELQSALAESGNPLPVVFLTGHGDVSTAVHAIKGGAEDFLTKPVRKENLLAAVERALARDAAAFEELWRRKELGRRCARLTAREREVLRHVLAGRLNKQIAAYLGTSVRTVKAHRASIMAKMQAQSPAELGRIAEEAGLGTKG